MGKGFQIGIRATTQNISGVSFQALGGDFEGYVTQLREHLHGSSFPWPGETTVVATMYAEVMNTLVDRAGELARELGVAGANQVVMAGSYTAAEECGIEAVQRIGTEPSA